MSLVPLAWSRPHGGGGDEFPTSSISPGRTSHGAGLVTRRSAIEIIDRLHCNWLVGRDRDAADLCPVETQSVVHSGFRRGLRPGLGLWVFCKAHGRLVSLKPFGLACRRYR